MITLFQTLLKKQDGVAAVEFAIIAPILVYIFVGIVDHGLLIREKMHMENAARSGVEFALKNGDNEEDMLLAILAAFFPEEFEDDPSLSSFDLNIDEVCECSDGAVLACSDTCPDEDDYRRRYLEVTMGKNYTMFMSYPGIDSDVYIEGTARIQKD